MADDEGAHQSASELAPVIPDYLASPNAVLGDEGVQWRYGKPPDYSKTRKVWEDSKLSASCFCQERSQPSSRIFKCHDRVYIHVQVGYLR